MSNELFDDVHAMVNVSKALAPVEVASLPGRAAIAAMEQGTRERPDGTVETYERLEFFPPSP